MKNSNDILTIGLGFGDEAKGSFIQYIAESNPNIQHFEKYNGGGQGRHCVKHQGKEYVFSQLSPSILYNRHTIIGANFVFEPFSLNNEISAIAQTMNVQTSEILKRLTINEQAICATQIHKLFNIAEEEFANLRGSVGTGISIAGYYTYESITLKAKDLKNKEIIQKILSHQKEYFLNLCIEKKYNSLEIRDVDINTLTNEMYEISKKFNITNLEIQDTQLFESSQGILLDRKYGFIPNTTLLDTSCDSKMNVINKIGFIRAIYTRHGKGVFPTESDWLNHNLSDHSQQVGKYSGKIRFGWFDCVLFRYAIEITQCNSVYMSYLDYLKYMDEIKICKCYEYIGDKKDEVQKVFACKNINNRLMLYNISGKAEDTMNFMSEIQPMYETISLKDMGFGEKVEEYLKFIENECNIHIDVISFGSNVFDKVVRK